MRISRRTLGLVRYAARNEVPYPLQRKPHNGLGARSAPKQTLQPAKGLRRGIKGRAYWLVLLGVGACLLVGPAIRPARGAGQEEAPNRREFTVTARDFRFTPDRLEVTQNDLVKVTIRSEDVAYSLTIDHYRVSRRVPAGGSTTFEFRADTAGTFAFYSNLTSDTRHTKMTGQLVVRPR